MLSLSRIARRAAVTVSSALLAAGVSAQLPTPTFENDPTVHDPSVIRVGDRFYVFGSHLQAAWTDDLMNWTQLSEGTGSGNTLIPNVAVEMKEAFDWSETNTFWAADVIQLDDGRFYMYYCVSRIDSPRASLGLAVSDSVEGPYENLGILLQSGMWGQISEDGTIYDATVHPNAVDPALFYDTQDRLWMVYGSYSGGIFIMEMDRETGLPLEGQGYGKKLMGGNHSRIEAPYILYHPETEYYYMFVSFGGLAADGGYNIRVARSRDPDGPYLDAQGTDMIEVKGAPGTLFDDASIAPHGVKLMGNWQFASVAGEPRDLSRGYVSPGHNSAYYDPETGKSLLFFHSRFVGRGELHQVRVHQLYFNEDGWPVTAPHRYAGESRGAYQKERLMGTFKLVEHGKDITAAVKASTLVDLKTDGSVSGSRTGEWQLLDGEDLRITLAGEEYRGVASHQWDDDNRVWVMTFSALSGEGEAIWGSKVANELSWLEQWRLHHFGSSVNAGLGTDSMDPDGDGRSNFLEYALGSEPLSAQERPEMIFRSEAGALQFRFGRVFDPGLKYTVEASPDLAAAEWTEALWSGHGSAARPTVVPLPSTSGQDASGSQFWRLRVELLDSL